MLVGASGRATKMAVSIASASMLSLDFDDRPVHFWIS